MPVRNCSLLQRRKWSVGLKPNPGQLMYPGLRALLEPRGMKETTEKQRYGSRKYKTQIKVKNTLSEKQRHDCKRRILMMQVLRQYLITVMEDTDLSIVKTI